MKQKLFEKIEQIVLVLRIWVFDYIDRLGTYMFLWVWVWFSKHESKFPKKSLCSKLGGVCVFCWHPKWWNICMKKILLFELNILTATSFHPHISYWLWVVTCQQHSQSPTWNVKFNSLKNLKNFPLETLFWKKQGNCFFFWEASAVTKLHHFPTFA